MQTKEQEIPILTVTQLTRAIKRQLETEFRFVMLQGEVSNCKLHSSGHFYFSLKDVEAQIAAVMYRGAASKLARIPKEGDQVIVKGELTVYPPSGRYQINVLELKPAGVGELLLKLEELKKLLLQKGWFSSAHKKPLPKLPKTIGVVTSPTGAAIQDILNVLSRRFAGFRLILNPVRVQGDTAAGEIAQAIKQFNDYKLVDVIIVGRGGGSIEDLWAFNELIVAEAIYNSTIPIISAVGHETDHTIADYVADVRAPTPSAAAEMVIAEQTEQVRHLNQITYRLDTFLKHTLHVKKQQLKAIVRLPLLASPYGLIGPSMQKLDGYHKRLELLKPTNKIRRMKETLYKLSSSIDRGIQLKLRHLSKHTDCSGKQKRLNQLAVNILSRIKQRYQALVNGLQSVDPKQVLKKGYAIPFSKKDGSVIKSVDQVQINQEIQLVLADGELASIVKGVKHNEHK